MENQAVENQVSNEATLSEHDQAMVDKIDNHETGVDNSLKTDEERMLAGKYKNVEDLEKAYEHLQSKMGQTEETAETEEVAVETEEAPKEAAEAIVAEAGIDYSAMESEYAELGGLSEETYKSLADAGIPETMVNAYIAGQEAITQNTVSTMHKIAGGEQGYSDMLSWAEDSLSEGEIEAFNDSLTNANTSTFAINGLYARYSAEKGPSLVKGNTTNTPSGGFGSKQEMMTEMASPQYKRDPAFRAEVQRRVAVSNF